MSIGERRACGESLSSNLFQRNDATNLVKPAWRERSEAGVSGRIAGRMSKFQDRFFRPDLHAFSRMSMGMGRGRMGFSLGAWSDRM